MPKIGVLIYTYNRVDDARINMEIIRNVWQKSDLLKEVKIVHSFNGEKDWWPEKYLEDELLYLDNPGHFAGAEILINEGVKTFQEKYPETDYVIILASDTWLVKPEWLEEKIIAMRDKEEYVAGSVWGTKKSKNVWQKGLSLDLNIFDLKWATKSGLFPIRFKEFTDKYFDLFTYHNQTPYPEIVFMVRFLEAILRTIKIDSDNMSKSVAEKYIRRITEREPIHINHEENLIFKKSTYIRTMYWPKIGLITHHEPEPKQKALRQWNLKLGASGERFIKAADLSYFNNGVTRHSFIKNKKKVDYHD